ncbi:MAG: hypothetical protein RLZZ71_1918 [Bacteroidota bacterium]|jgi:hypothetical protein
MVRQSNVSMSYYGNFDPILEIVNTSSTNINLSQYFLSDDPLTPFKWQFPAIPFAVNARAQVYLSGRNMTTPQWHTSFKLDDTEGLYLSNSNGIISTIPPVTHYLNVSYSRYPDITGDFQYTTPTIGFPNVEGTLNMPTPPVNLTPMGVLPPGSTLNFSGVTGNTRYTVNGIEVQPNSPLLPSSLTLPNPAILPNRFSAIPANPELNFPLFDYTESRANNRGYVQPYGNVQKINILRVRAFSEEGLETEEQVYSYFPATPSFGLPIISVITDSVGFFDDEHGIYVWGDTSMAGNYNQTGAYYERISHLQFFDVNGTFVKQIKMGGRIHGNGSRHSPQKSFRFYTRSSIDNQDFLLPNGVKTNVIMLRSGGHRPDCIGRDFLGCKIVEEMEMDHADPYLHAVFINGEFWGLYDLRARIDADFIGRRYKIEEDFVGMIDQTYQISEGYLMNPSEYEDLTLFASENPMTDENYNYISDRLDISLFSDLMCTQVYYGNHDFPVNNVGAWKYNGWDGESKWKHYIFDLDGSFGGSCSTENVDDETLDYYLNTNTLSMVQSTRIIRNLLENPNYEDYFINRMADLLNTQFKPSIVTNKFNLYQNQVNNIRIPHLYRFRYPSSVETLLERQTEIPNLNKWDERFAGYADYFENRPRYVREEFMNEFNVNDSVKFVVNVNDESMGKVQLNSLFISNLLIGANTFNVYPWTGIYFSSVPVELTAASKYGYKFDSWSMTSNTSATLNYSSSSDQNITANFSVDPNFLAPVVNEVMASNSNVLADDFGQHEDWIEIYNPNPYPITLEGYRLTDDISVPNKFVIASKAESIVPAYGYRIFYASNVTQRGADHTNFKISVGETIQLSAPNGTVLSSLSIPSWLVPNSSYGSSPNGSNNTWGMFSQSTPGAENPSGVADIENELTNIFKLYPNPTNEGEIDCTAFGNYRIFDLQGRLMGIYNNTRKLSIDGLQAGVYLVVNEFGSSERLVKL